MTSQRDQSQGQRDQSSGGSEYQSLPMTSHGDDEASDANLMPASDMVVEVQTPYMSTPVTLDATSDYVLVLPLLLPEDFQSQESARRSESEAAEAAGPPKKPSFSQRFSEAASLMVPMLSKSSIWAATRKNPVESAEKIFKHSCDRITQVFESGYKETMRKRFSSTSDESAYQNEVRKLLVEVLASHKCGFILSEQTSIDEDEIFLMLKLPRSKNSDFKMSPSANIKGNSQRGNAMQGAQSMPVQKAMQDEEEAGMARSNTNPEPGKEPRQGRSDKKEEVYVDQRPADQQIATRMAVRSALNEDCYRKVDKDLRLRRRSMDQNGVFIPAYYAFTHHKESWFEPFMDIQRIRMVRRHLASYIDIAELQRQGIVTSEFPCHNWEHVCDFGEEFAKVTKWYSPLRWSYDCSQAVRDYFGEELAFFFSWTAFFTRSLLFPAVGGILVAAFHKEEHSHLKWLPTILAGFMACYATTINEGFKRLTHRNIQRWGMKSYHQVAATRSEYDSSLDGTWQVDRWKYISMVATFFFMCLIVGSVMSLQFAKFHILHHMHQSAIPQTLMGWGLTEDLTRIVIMKAGMGLLVLQMIIMDLIWTAVATALANKQNFKTTQQHSAELVYKLVPVKLFNYMFSFLYIAFLKPALGRCVPDVDGCILELKESVFLFFVTRSMYTSVSLVLANRRVSRELREELAKAKDGSHMTYVQVQAKLDGFLGLTEDYMSFIAGFAIVACFSIVFLQLGALALFTNLVELRLLGLRNVYTMKRVYPTGSEGTGAWNEIFEAVGKMAVFVNCGLAVFILEPCRSYCLRDKLAMFLVAEHVVFFLKASIEVAIDDMPHDVQRIEEASEEAIAAMMGHEDGEARNTEVEIMSDQLHPLVDISADKTLVCRKPPGRA